MVVGREKQRDEICGNGGDTQTGDTETPKREQIETEDDRRSRCKPENLTTGGDNN